MTDRPHPLDQIEIRFGAGGGVLVLTVVLARLARLDEPYAALLVLVVTAALATTVGRGRAVVLGMTGWALFTGFLVHRYGVLTLAPGDLLLLAVLTTVAVGGSVVGHRPARRPADPTYGRLA